MSNKQDLVKSGGNLNEIIARSKISLMKLQTKLDHRHQWNDIIENPSGKVIGHHCFWCGETEKETKFCKHDAVLGMCKKGCK